MPRCASRCRAQPPPPACAPGSRCPDCSDVRVSYATRHAATRRNTRLPATHRARREEEQDEHDGENKRTTHRAAARNGRRRHHGAWAQNAALRTRRHPRACHAGPRRHRAALAGAEQPRDTGSGAGARCTCGAEPQTGPACALRHRRPKRSPSSRRSLAPLLRCAAHAAPAVPRAPWSVPRQRCGGHAPCSLLPAARSAAAPRPLRCV